MDRLAFEKLRTLARGRKPVVLQGARQVGKTYLLKQLGQRDFPAVHYLNFEREEQRRDLFEGDLQPQRILDALAFHFQRPINKNTDLLIFDEIQHAPKALTSLKYFAEEMPELALCAAGSLLGLQLNAGSFPVGKVEIVHLYPLTFEEFLMALGETDLLQAIAQAITTPNVLPSTAHERLWQHLKYYFVVGGLPEAVTTYVAHRQQPLEAVTAVRRIQETLLLTYLADMAKHSGKQNSMHLERLLRHIPEYLARAHDHSVRRFRFKEVLPGIHGYTRMAPIIDWLEKTNLILRTAIANKAALPLAAYTKENCFKLYLFDVGLLGALSHLSPKVLLDYHYGSYQGYVAENFVAQELTAQEMSLYAWTEQTAEIEFLWTQDQHIYPVEVKSGQRTQAKSLSVFAKVYHPARQIILSARPPQNQAASGKQHYPLYLAGFLSRILTASP